MKILAAGSEDKREEEEPSTVLETAMSGILGKGKPGAECNLVLLGVTGCGKSGQIFCPSLWKRHSV